VKNKIQLREITHLETIQIAEITRATPENKILPTEILPTEILPTEIVLTEIQNKTQKTERLTQEK